MVVRGSTLETVFLPVFNVNAPVQPATQSASSILFAAYVAVSAALAARCVYSYLRLRVRLGQHPRERQAGYTLVRGTDIGPGTLGRLIFLPGRDTELGILRHEVAHIRSGHRFDLALLLASRVVFWISPAHWLLGRELRIVHEFEADRIASAGESAQDYADLLLQVQFAACTPVSSSHSFFHHPLKRRIMMLQKKAPANAKMLLAATLLLTAGFTGTVLFAQTTGGTAGPALAMRTKPLRPDVLRNNYMQPQPGTVTTMGDGRIVFTKVDQMPKFDGELMKWLIANVRHPGTEFKGRCLVQFTVDASGNVVQPMIEKSSGDPKVDAEALRVIRSMPAWKPGLQGGIPVSVLYKLPFNFGNLGEGC